MPSSPLESWYCDHVVNGSWQIIILVIPTLGAYYFGQDKRKIAYILFAAWFPVQIAMSYINNVVVSCPGDPISQEQLEGATGGAKQPSPPAGDKPAQ